MTEGVASSINCFLGSKPEHHRNQAQWHKPAIPALGVEKDPPQLYSKFKASLSYMRPCQEKGGRFQAWYYMPFTPSLRNQRQEDLVSLGLPESTQQTPGQSRSHRDLVKKRERGEEIRGEGEVEREGGNDSKSDAQMSHEL